MPFLIGLTGPYTDEVLEIQGARVTVGRGPGCNLLLDRDPAVSRAHALLVMAGGVVQVQDAGSTHGTYVNGRRVEQAVLRSGDCVQFGGSLFQLQPVPAPVNEPPRLKVVVPRGEAWVPGMAPPDPPVSGGLGCLLVLCALLVPVPAGFLIGIKYLKRKHPSNQVFATVVLLLSLVSTLVQLWVGIALTRQILETVRPLGPGGDWGL